MSKYYVLLDAIGIQSYIFQTNTLKIILGSSLSLAQWQKRCETICNNNKGNLITSAGGNVLAEFNSKTDAEKFRQECIKKAPSDMEIAWAEAEEQGKDADTWIMLQREVARYKAGDRELNDYPLMKNKGLPGCLHCGLRPEDHGEKKDEKNICSVCRILYNHGEKLNKNAKNAKKGDTTCIESLYEIPFNNDLPEGFPVELEKMVSRDDSKDMMAVVVIDLNNMGNRVKEITKKESGFKELKDFSKNLEEEYCNIFKEAVKETGQKSDGFSKKQQFIRLRPLLLGGDDAVFAMPAPLWPGFVISVLCKLRQKGYPACAGIAIAKENYPFSRLFYMAEELVKSAKGLIHYYNLQDCAIDWHIHQESAFANPLEARKRNYIFRDDNETFWQVSTKRPYTLDDFILIKDNASELKKLIQNNKFSNRKLYALYQALRQGVNKTRDTLTYVFLRNEDEKFQKYPFLWENIYNQLQKNDNNFKDYPLWEIVKSKDNTLAFGKDNRPVYVTKWTDIIEIEWMLEGLS